MGCPSVLDEPVDITGGILSHDLEPQSPETPTVQDPTAPIAIPSCVPSPVLGQRVIHLFPQTLPALDTNSAASE